VEIQTVEQVQYIHQDSIYEIEKWLDASELDVNIEGIDVVLIYCKK
jgi:hypothetical protein